MDQAVAARPAVLVAFDLLELAATDLTEQVLDNRRVQLEDLLSARQPCVQLVLQTADVDVAREWLTLLPSLEGVVAKRGDGRYESGRRRDWVKVKRYRTVDCVVIGVTGDTGAPRLVLWAAPQRRHDPSLRTLRGVNLSSFRPTYTGVASAWSCSTGFSRGRIRGTTLEIDGTASQSVTSYAVSEPGV